MQAIVGIANEAGDSPMAVELREKIPSLEATTSLTDDRAYDTQDVHEAFHRRGAISIIPPQSKGTRLHKWLAFTHRNEAVKACKRLGRAICKRWSGHHRRSLVEMMMNCFKRLGEKVMTWAFERQVAEINIRVPPLQRLAELGGPKAVLVA